MLDVGRCKSTIGSRIPTTPIIGDPSGRPLRLRFLPSRFNDTFTLLVYSVPLSMSLYVPRGGAFGQQMNNVFSIIEPSCSFTVTRYLRVRWWGDWTLDNLLYTFFLKFVLRKIDVFWLLLELLDRAKLTWGLIFSFICRTAFLTISLLSHNRTDVACTNNLHIFGLDRLRNFKIIYIYL